MDIPLHRQYAIEFERQLLEHRRRQIEGYLLRIKFLSEGKGGYGDALKEVPPRVFEEHFNWKKYSELRRKHKENSRLLHERKRDPRVTPFAQMNEPVIAKG